MRINAPGPAVDHVLCPLAFSFLRSYRDVQIEIVSDAAIVDIVQQGFDAGVRFGRHVAQDMVATPLGPPLRYAIVASPEYLRERGEPTTPHDLTQHDCIRRCFPGGTIPTWSFGKDGSVLEVTPVGRLMLSSAQQELQAALAGQGIAHVFEDYALSHVESGALVELLADWKEELASWFLYYPSRRHPSAAFKAFLEHVRRRGQHRGMRPSQDEIAV